MAGTHATPNPARARRPAPWSVLVAVFLLWLVGSVGLLLWAAEPTLTFLGDVPTAEERALHESRLLWAFVGSTVPATAGLVLAIGGRRSGWAVVFAVALLVVGAAWAAEAAHDSIEPSGDGPAPCVEHSGGDSRCPGG